MTGAQTRKFKRWYRKLDAHSRYQWYAALGDTRRFRNRLRAPQTPTSDAPWLSAAALSYRRGIGRSSPYLA